MRLANTARELQIARRAPLDARKSERERPERGAPFRSVDGRSAHGALAQAGKLVANHLECAAPIASVLLRCVTLPRILGRIGSDGERGADVAHDVAFLQAEGGNLRAVFVALAVAQAHAGQGRHGANLLADLGQPIRFQLDEVGRQGAILLRFGRIVDDLLLGDHVVDRFLLAGEQIQQSLGGRIAHARDVALDGAESVARILPIGHCAGAHDVTLRSVQRAAQLRAEVVAPIVADESSDGAHQLVTGGRPGTDLPLGIHIAHAALRRHELNGREGSLLWEGAAHFGRDLPFRHLGGRSLCGLDLRQLGTGLALLLLRLGGRNQGSDERIGRESHGVSSFLSWRVWWSCPLYHYHCRMGRAWLSPWPWSGLCIVHRVCQSEERWPKVAPCGTS